MAKEETEEGLGQTNYKKEDLKQTIINLLSDVA